MQLKYRKDELTVSFALNLFIFDWTREIEVVDVLSWSFRFLKRKKLLQP